MRCAWVSARSVLGKQAVEEPGEHPTETFVGRFARLRARVGMCRCGVWVASVGNRAAQELDLSGELLLGGFLMGAFVLSDRVDQAAHDGDRLHLLWPWRFARCEHAEVVLDHA